MKPSEALRKTTRPQLDLSEKRLNIAEMQYGESDGEDTLYVSALWAIYEEFYGHTPGKFWDWFDLRVNLVADNLYWEYVVLDPEWEKYDHSGDKLMFMITLLEERGWSFARIADWLESLGL